MDGKTLARIGAVVFVAVAITATAIEMTRTGPGRQTRSDRNAARHGARSAAARNCPLLAPWVKPAGAIRPACAMGREPAPFLGQPLVPSPAAPGDRLFPERPRRGSRRQPPPPGQAREALTWGTGVIDHFLEVFTRYIDGGLACSAARSAFIATDADRHRRDARRPVLDGAPMTTSSPGWSRRRCSSASSPHHRQLEQPRPYRLRELRRPRPEGVGHRLHHRHRSLMPRQVAQTGLDAGRPLLDPSPT